MARSSPLSTRVSQQNLFLIRSLEQEHWQAEHWQCHEMSAFREGGGAKSADHRRRTWVRRAGVFPKVAWTKWRWRAPLGIYVAFTERLRRHQSTRNRQKLQRREEVRLARCYVPHVSFVFFQFYHFSLFSCFCSFLDFVSPFFSFFFFFFFFRFSLTPHLPCLPLKHRFLLQKS